MLTEPYLVALIIFCLVVIGWQYSLNDLHKQQIKKLKRIIEELEIQANGAEKEIAHLEKHYRNLQNTVNAIFLNLEKDKG